MVGRNETCRIFVPDNISKDLYYCWNLMHQVSDALDGKENIDQKEFEMLNEHFKLKKRNTVLELQDRITNSIIKVKFRHMHLC